MKQISNVLWGLKSALLMVSLSLPSLAAAQANLNQTVTFGFPSSCDAQGGTLDSNNFITDFDNGTFGINPGGLADQSPDVDPYPAQTVGGVTTGVSGGNFNNDFFDFEFGDYTYIGHNVERRNDFQHPNGGPNRRTNNPITDPENGVNGRFFASDPDNDNTPVLNFSITNIIPNENYELAFWAANSEPNGNANIIEAVLDGLVSFSTGDLEPDEDALPWQRYAFVFNAGDRDTITLSIESTVDGRGGLDFYLDNVTLKRCLTAPAQTGSIEGSVYIDSNENNNFDAAEGGLANIDVQLFDVGGASDIFISSVDTNPDGSYAFINLLPSADFQVRVDTDDADLLPQLVIGTPNDLDVTVTAGNTSSDNDFGFDAGAALLQAEKTVEMFEPDGAELYAIPGNEVIYTITTTNRGAGPTDNNTLFLVDDLPPEVEFFNGDFDGAGNPVLFEQNGASLNFLYSRDVGFSRSTTKPADFSACTDTPTGTYDDTINFICFAPNGEMNFGTPDPEFSVSFRTRIR